LVLQFFVLLHWDFVYLWMLGLAAIHKHTLSLRDALPISADADELDAGPRAELAHCIAEVSRDRRLGHAHAVGDHSVRLTGDHLRSEEHTSELQSRENLVCRLLLEKKKCSV